MYEYSVNSYLKEIWPFDELLKSYSDMKKADQQAMMTATMATKYIDTTLSLRMKHVQIVEEKLLEDDKMSFWRRNRLLDKVKNG